MLKTEEYRWKASECRRKAEEARHLVDKHAWLELAADWSKLNGSSWSIFKIGGLVASAKC